MKDMQRSSFPDDIMLALDYDPDTGSFSYNGEPVTMWRTARYTLVSVPPFSVSAHRLAFQVCGYDVKGLVVIALDGDIHNLRASNLCAIRRRPYVDLGFFQRKLARDPQHPDADYCRRKIAEFLDIARINCLATLLEVDLALPGQEASK